MKPMPELQRKFRFPSLLPSPQPCYKSVCTASYLPWVSVLRYASSACRLTMIVVRRENRGVLLGLLAAELKELHYSVTAAATRKN